MTANGLDPAGLARLHDGLAAQVENGVVPGLTAVVARDDDVQVEVLGSLSVDDPEPMPRDALFRIASLTKPIAAAGAMALVEQGRLALADPVEKYLPELADRRVLRTLESPVDDTVPAERLITVEDLLTCRFGFGALMAPPGTYPFQAVEIELELKTIGPPWPPTSLTSDQWIARFATLPLMHQPGQGWQYNTGIHVLGVLLERATGRPLEELLRTALFEPLGMVDTAFSVPAEKAARFTTAYASDANGNLTLVDPPSGGWWNQPPAMQNAAGWLVSTIDDFWAFVSMLVNAGTHNGTEVLSPDSVAGMTRDHLTADERTSSTTFLGSHSGWGYGMAAPGPISGEPPIPWGFGWDGGLGTTWRTDPVRGISCILFTQRALTSPEPPPLFTDFFNLAYAAMED